MDLTKNYPRSVHEKYLGIVQLGRALDKGKAKAHGNIGEYNFDLSDGRRGVRVSRHQR